MKFDIKQFNIKWGLISLGLNYVMMVVTIMVVFGSQISKGLTLLVADFMWVFINMIKSIFAGNIIGMLFLLLPALILGYIIKEGDSSKIKLIKIAIVLIMTLLLSFTTIHTNAQALMGMLPT